MMTPWVSLKELKAVAYLAANELGKGEEQHYIQGPKDVEEEPDLVEPSLPMTPILPILVQEWVHRLHLRSKGMKKLDYH